jgi:hypothetical protein
MTTDVPLPEPSGTVFHSDMPRPYSESEMHAYGDARAAAAVQAERERMVREVMPLIPRISRAGVERALEGRDDMTDTTKSDLVQRLRAYPAWGMTEALLNDAIGEIETLRAQLEAAQADAARAQRCLGFFASVIKSGEDWSSRCQQEYDAAMQAEGAAR